MIALEKWRKMANITVNDLIRLIPMGFKAENAENVQTNIQIIATGSDGGEWVVRIKEKNCSIENGLMDNPDLTLTAETGNIIKMFLGELDPLRAYMQGKISFKGRIKQALALTNLFTTDRAFYESLL